MKREYKIAHFPKENERAIFRKFEWMEQWLRPWMVWSKDKRNAKRFLREQDATSVLIFIRTQWELKTEEEYIEEKIEEQKEKRSWSELHS